MNTSPMSLKDISNHLRAELQNVADYMTNIKKQGFDTFPVPETADKGESIANFTLAYRHVEDAKMRLGKVIQAIEGVSVYDTPAVNLVGGQKN